MKVKDLSLPYNAWDRTKQIVLDIKALNTGTATPEQQQRFLNYLIVVGCRTYDSDWFPDERTSCFAAGRRHVGQQILQLLNTNVGQLKE